MYSQRYAALALYLAIVDALSHVSIVLYKLLA
jgi:hypothetical protein